MIVQSHNNPIARFSDVDPQSPINPDSAFATGILSFYIADLSFGQNQLIDLADPSKRGTFSANDTDAVWSGLRIIKPCHGRRYAEVLGGDSQDILIDRPFVGSLDYFTIMMWMDPVELTNYFGKWSGISSPSQILFRYKAGQAQAFVRNAADTAEGKAYSASLLVEDQWNFVAIVGDGSDIRLYIACPATQLQLTEGTSASLAGPYFPTDTADWRFGSAHDAARDACYDSFLMSNTAYSKSAIQAYYNESANQWPTLLNRPKQILFPAIAGGVTAPVFLHHYNTLRRA